MKTSKASSANFFKNYTVLREGGTEGSGHPAAYFLRVLRSLALCAALGAAWPSMAQPIRHDSGQAASSVNSTPGLPGSGLPAFGAGSGQALPDRTTSHPANPSENDGQAVGYVVEVYKSAQCGCCKAWAEHLQKNGFTVISHDVDDVPATRKQLGMPSRFGSCHTAKVGQYLIEGHVPAADIKKLLKKQPKAIGLAVPSMPPGSPGMESERSIPYDTLLIGADGNAKVFARH